MKSLLVCLFLLCYSNTLGQEDSRELILSGVDAMYEKDHELSLELLTRAQSIAEENGLNEELFLALNNIGANYYLMLDYGEALDYYLEAYKIAIKELEPFHEMSALNNIAILYSKDGKFDKAEEYFMIAYSLAKENNDEEKQALYAANLGHIYNEQQKLNKGEEFLKEALKLAKDDPRLFKDAKVTMTKNQLLRGDLVNAKSNALELLPQLMGDEFSEQRTSVLLVISKTFQAENNLTEAINYAKKGLTDEVNIEHKIEIYNQLSLLYVESKMYEEAIKLKDTLISAYNEMGQIKNRTLYETNRVKFEVQNYQNEIKNKQEKIIAQQKRFYILLLGSILVILLFGWALRISYINNKQRKSLHNKGKEIMELELEKEKAEHLLLEKQLKEQEAQSLLVQERLKNEIESKNRKLSAKALFLSDRNELVTSIIKDVESLNALSRHTQLGIHIRKLKGLLKSDDEWDSFVNHFEEVNQGVLSKLKNKHSDLNTNDIRFISYLFMNLSTKEIASIFNITPEACRKRKERVSKKMGLEASTQLYDYLYQA